MKLTVAAINSVVATGKKQRFYDGLGLYLEVSPAGSKLWRFKYRFGGLEKVLSLGQYPLISLKMARGRHLEAREQLERRIDPGELKKYNSPPQISDSPFSSGQRKDSITKSKAIVKGLGNYQYTVLLPIFGPSLTVPQSQNPRHNTIMPAILFNRHSQI